MFGKNLVLKLYAKILPANQIAGFLNFNISKTIGVIKLNWCCDFTWMGSGMPRMPKETITVLRYQKLKAGFFPCTFCPSTFFMFQIEFVKGGRPFLMPNRHEEISRGSAECCKPPSRSRAEPWWGTKRQSTRKLSIFGLWESLTLA